MTVLSRHVDFWPNILLFMTNINVLQFLACGEELRKEKGNIESPNYPSTYPANAACVWIITVPTGYQVNFEIQNIQVSLIL